MKTIYPNYYKGFKCIADKCNHSCCIGWEIDIDKHSLSYYEALTGKFSKRLKDAISYDGEPHFILTNGERCPFLNKDGLCDMIIELGEEALCDICTDHPRFRNYYKDAVELGLGLCCEAAASLILNNQAAFSLENFSLNDNVYTPKEKALLSLRSELIEIMKNRNESLQKRHNRLMSKLGCNLTDKNISKWCDFYLGLERLDSAWGEILEELREASPKDIYSNLDPAAEIALEQLTIYFLYRYIPMSTSVEETKKYLCFSIISTKMIAAILSKGKFSIEECARMYSSEIEYSDENVVKICNEFS